MSAASVETCIVFIFLLIFTVPAALSLLWFSVASSGILYGGTQWYTQFPVSGREGKLLPASTQDFSLRELQPSVIIFVVFGLRET